MSIWVLAVLALIAACGTISPRRVVINNPPSSPTPTVSPTPFVSPTPTPFPTPTITPTPTPTPTAMGAVVPAQFLFTADQNAGVILGFKINRDGGLSPVPGSPFVTPNSPTLVAAAGKNLLVADKAGLTAFSVDKESGTITRIDSAAMPAISSLTVDKSENVTFATAGTRRVAFRVVNGKLQSGSESGIMLLRSGTSALTAQATSAPSVMDSSGQFSYSLNRSTGEISAFRMDGGKLVSLSPASYPAGHAAVSLAVAQP